jgi:hypothetical protein
MIRFQNHGGIPKSLRDTKVFTIVTRNTLYGFHKNVRKHNDEAYSKTNLLCFINKQDAEIFYEQLQQIRNPSGGVIECDETSKNLCVLPFISNTRTLLPLRVEALSLQDLQKLCLLHYFDMYVGFNIVYNDYEDCYCIDYYDFISEEPPNRGIQVSFLENMLLL